MFDETLLVESAVWSDESGRNSVWRSPRFVTIREDEVGIASLAAALGEVSLGWVERDGELPDSAAIDPRFLATFGIRTRREVLRYAKFVIGDQSTVAGKTTATVKVLGGEHVMFEGPWDGSDGWVGLAGVALEMLERSPKPGRRVVRKFPSSAFDTPQGFGVGFSWFAVRSADAKKVAKCFGLGGLDPIDWHEGLSIVEQDAAFVSSPVNGWVFVVAQVFSELAESEDSEDAERFAKRVSRKLDTDVQFFHVSDADERAENVCVWARSGKRVRLITAWFGKSPVTDGERVLVGQGWPELVFPSADDGADDAGADDDEDGVLSTDHALAIAGVWGIDPRTVDQFGPVTASWHTYEIETYMG
jgi:hypothetical protein